MSRLSTTTKAYEKQLQDEQKRLNAVKKRLDAMLAQGMAPKLAEMLAYQAPPGSRGTDRAFLEGGMERKLAEMHPNSRAHLLHRAKEAGIDMAGKVYMSGLADERGPGDPLAWVADSHDVQKVAQARGLEVEGAVRHKPTMIDKPAKQVRLNEKIVKEIASHRLKNNPSEASRDPRELREEIVEKHGSKKEDL